MATTDRLGSFVVVTFSPSRDLQPPSAGQERDDTVAPDGIGSQIETELIRYVVRQAPVGFAIGIVAVAGVALVLWNAVPRGALVLWLLAIGVLTLPACAVVWRFAHATDVAKAIRWWHWSLTVAYGLAGAGWGVAAVVLYPHAAVPYQTFLMFILGGAGVSGVAALAPVRSAFIAYLTATFVPLVILLLSAGSTASLATGVLLVAFWVSTVSLASALRALLVRSLRLHFENLANLETLTRTRDVLQKALSSTTRDVADLANELAAADRAKDEFLAIVSHELRTPLTPILTWASLMRRSRLDAAVMARGLDAIERNTKLQSRIVEDLLDVSRAITGKLKIDVSPLSLDAVVDAALDAAQAAANAKGVHLEPHVDRDVPWISGDAERLQQIVWNLVSNAVKFTPRGGRVDVGLSNVGGEVRLTVRDDGVGIAAASLPRLFERFWQCDTSTTRMHGGLGLGLAVVRHLVELHGGTVTAESEGEGRGALFTVMLPALSSQVFSTEAPAEGRVERRDDPLHGVRILVVDDDADTCDTIGALFQAQGAEVRTCLSASAALEVLDVWLPDIMMSDIAMPGEDGYTLMRKIRARKPDAGGRMLAVALTAYGSNEDRLRALAAGFQIHVGKPIAPDQLISIVTSVVATDSRH